MKPEYNILSNMDDAEFRLMRKRTIEMILATDMAKHNKSVNTLKNKLTDLEQTDTSNLYEIIENPDSSIEFDNKQLILNNILHAADISNPAKVSKVYKKWVDLIFVEFFYQGDCEKKENLTISLLCDRETTVIPKTQVGFIKFVVRPTFEIMVQLFPEINTYLEFINKNLKIYEDEIKILEKKAKQNLQIK